MLGGARHFGAGWSRRRTLPRRNQAPSASAETIGLKAFSTANHWDNTSIVTGSGTMTMAAVVRYDANPAGPQAIWTRFTSGLTANWAIYHHTGGAFRGNVGNGAGVSQTITWGSVPTIGKTYSVVLRYNAPTLDLFVQGVKHGTPVNTGGGYTTSAPTYLSCGAFSGNDFANATASTILGGVFHGASALSDADIAAWHASCATAPNGVADFPGGAQELWRVSDIGAGATWQSAKSATVLNKVGTGATQEILVPVWA